MLDAYRAYIQSIRDGYLERPQGHALDRARLTARITRSQFEASLARLRAEPASSLDHIAAFNQIVADSNRFVHAVMSLEAGLLTSHTVPARDAFHTFANDVDVTLYYLAAGLRGSPIAVHQFPDLREDHHALLQSGDPRIERYALVNVETDRITNSLNTITGEILSLSRSTGHAQPRQA